MVNIVFLVFIIGNKFFFGVICEVLVIYIIVIVGCIFCSLLVFFWKEIIFVVGVEWSIVLLVLCFFVVMVDCFFLVIFFFYMVIF